jgi:hypothetical protein
MKRYVDYLGSKSRDDIVSHGLGDWYDLGPRPPGEAQLTPKALTATAFYFEDASILAKTAALLGRDEDAERYHQLAGRVRDAFNRTFYQADHARYASGSQCANSVPLVMGLANPPDRTRVLDNIVKDIRDRHNSLTAGDVGYGYLLRALAEGGRSDVIFDMNDQSATPGYGYQLKQGATSLTEAWDAGRASSQNHFMLGQITAWFYHDLAGIAGDPDGPGFQKVIIQPRVVGDLTWVKAYHDTLYGRVASAWKIEGNRIGLDVSIPVNTTATVYVPTSDPSDITESGHRPNEAKGVRFIRSEPGAAVFAIGSGDYHFSARRP